MPATEPRPSERRLGLPGERLGLTFLWRQDRGFKSVLVTKLGTPEYRAPDIYIDTPGSIVGGTGGRGRGFGRGAEGQRGRSGGRGGGAFPAPGERPATAPAAPALPWVLCGLGGGVDRYGS